MRDRSKPWFAPKRYGYGAGLPIAWQGWAVLLIYVLVCGGAIFLPLSFAPDSAILSRVGMVVFVIATIVLILLSAVKTKGGWRWRWGKDN